MTGNGQAWVKAISLMTLSIVGVLQFSLCTHYSQTVFVQSSFGDYSQTVRALAQETILTSTEALALPV